MCTLKHSYALQGLCVCTQTLTHSHTMLGARQHDIRKNIRATGGGLARMLVGENPRTRGTQIPVAT